MDADNIKQEIHQIRHYNVETLRALAQLALEIRNVQEAPVRKELTQLFEMVHARRVAVWSRIPQRFPQAMTDSQITTDAFLCLAYLCQLPRAVALDLYEAHLAHLNEPGALQLIRAEVNAQRQPHPSVGLADQIADIYLVEIMQNVPVNAENFMNRILDLPAVRRALERAHA